MKKAISTIILIIAVTILWSSTDVLAIKDYRLIKTADDAKVFLVKENRRIHIPNEQVFEAGGYSWGDIETVTKLQMNKITDTALIKSPVNAKVYLIAEGKKQWIPNEKTFLGAGLKWDDIVLISQSQVEFYLEENFNQSDVVIVIKSLNSKTNSDVSLTTNIVDNIVDDYKRPDNIKVQEIGKYEKVYPGSGDNSIGDFKLFNNGQVYLSKRYLNKGDVERKNYIWEDGNFTLYTESDYLFNMNNNGQKVVVDYDFSQFSVFLDNKKLTKIQTLGGYSVSVLDMNNSGQLIGESDVRGGGIDGGVSHAFLWQNGIMQDLGTLGGNDSVAEAINDKGQIVGYSHDSTGEVYAFIWQDGKMNKISDGVTYLSIPGDINNNGLITGWSNFKKAYLYYKDGQFHDLDINSHVIKVNNYDEIAGTVLDGDLIDEIYSHYSSTMYSKISDRLSVGVDNHGYAAVHINGETIRLNDLIEDNNILFNSVNGFNDRGEILVTGFNYRDSYSYEYLVSLPNVIEKIFNDENSGVIQEDDTVVEEVNEEEVIENEIIK